MITALALILILKSGHSPFSHHRHPDQPIQTSAPAVLVVNLPSDAKLTIDDTVTQTATATRYFTTPPLEFGQEYNYALKAEVTRNGKTIIVNKEIAVRGGEQSKIDIDLPALTVTPTDTDAKVTSKQVNPSVQQNGEPPLLRE